MTERIPQYPPVIEPVPDQIRRPLWSVMIPTYNCSQYLIENIRSVLEQAPGPELMQIEVVDDYSTDSDVESIVQRIGKGRISYYRQPKNVGSLRNFETCLNRSKGHYIHLLHGDDKVKKGFYKEIENVFSSFPEAGAAFTGFTVVDEQNQPLYYNNDFLYEPGILKNWLPEIARSQLIQPPAMVVKRSVYEKLGSFYGVHYGEDWEMWVRIAAHYPVAHSPAKLAFYRVHQNNITSRYFLSGQSLSDITKVIDTIQTYLPPNERVRVKQYAKRHVANYFSYTSDKIYHFYGKPQVALEQARRAMGMHFSYITLMYWLKIHFKILIRYKLQSERKWIYRHPLNFFK
jgi:glycosyltransferase involved in cell wall biosynthesis